MDELITELNGLTSYPNLADMHALAVKIQAYAKEDVETKLIPALTNKLLADDIKRLLVALPSTMNAPIVVAPTAPSDPNYPGVDETTDPGLAAGTPPEIKP
jgi:hypothetical protein